MITVGYVQGGWQREVAIGSEGTREIGWLKGGWTEGGRLQFLGGVGCSKGAIAIGGRQGVGGGAAVCATIAEEGSGSIEQETTADHVQFIAGHNHDSWPRKIIAGCEVDRL
ncbi:hypothetical protein BHE74_00036463 [Ensete ventricosum]|nr:hypothetical protein BHE74_00036463 [Ensete ventricosum]